MKTNLQTSLRRTIPGSATRALQRTAIADVDLLLRKGAHSISSLIDFAQDSRQQTDVRSAACWALGQLRSQKAVPALLDLVERGHPEISWEAAKSLVVIVS